MSLTPLLLFKEHQRLSGDDDELAQHYLDAAEEAISQRIGVALGDGEGQQALTSALKSAALLWAGHLYEHREAVVTGTIATSLPLTVDALIAPYRRWDREQTR
ncbi:head-tail connector protein [Falsigemmobacter faecalis]|uniref:Phage gp6-like head-tail connector protein n=1 Tax=Falsigemmobacter faecalis TaxID=2488730 RepID=A0A3P3DCD6_9RHOB|nr:head-tail connector protein [Falsigemmobacter faecalis]RRH71999.1 phage gp6-like head-tail connector protein [Falsigemmobacter faecalis]